MAEPSELERFVAAARRRLVMVPDKDLFDRAMKRMRKEFDYWKEREQALMRRLALGRNAQDPRIVNDVAQLRKQLFHSVNVVAQEFEKEQSERYVRNNDEKGLATLHLREYIIHNKPGMDPFVEADIRGNTVGARPVEDKQKQLNNALQKRARQNQKARERGPDKGRDRER